MPRFDHVQNDGINQWTKRLHQIVSQGKSIQPVGMMKADCGMNACGDNRTCHCSAHDRITVIEESVGALGMLASALVV